MSLSMWAESRLGTTGVTVGTPQVSLSNVGRITSGHYRCHCRDTTGVAINVGRITSGHYRCRYQCRQNHVGTLQVSLSVWEESLSGHYRCRYQCRQNHVRALQVSLSVWAESRRDTYRCRYQCGQNHVGTLQVSLSVWAESRRDTTGVAISVGRITSGHYMCRYQCGQNHVRTLQVSLSVWAESRRDTTQMGAIAVDHPASPNSVSDEKTREESRVIAGRNRCYGTQPTMSAVGVTRVHMHEEQIAP